MLPQRGTPHPGIAAGRFAFSLGMMGCPGPGWGSCLSGRALLWRCEASLMSQAGACCASPSVEGRSILVQNQPLKRHLAPSERWGAWALPL